MGVWYYRNMKYKTSSKPNEVGTYDRWLLDQNGNKVCKAEIMVDKDGNVVVIQLDTPPAHRRRGYARHLLNLIGIRETTKELRVISTETALGFYRKLGFTEIAPHVFSYPSRLCATSQTGTTGVA